MNKVRQYFDRTSAQKIVFWNSSFGKQSRLYDMELMNLCLSSTGVGGPHPGNTFITIKNTIYNTKSINVKTWWCCFCALRDEMSGATDETGHANLLIAITWALTRPHNFKWHRAMVEGNSAEQYHRKVFINIRLKGPQVGHPWSSIFEITKDNSVFPNPLNGRNGNMLLSKR